MPDDDRLRDQLASIGGRYIRRTLGELDRLAALMPEVQQRSPTALKELVHLAHKIHGSGAMFGFEEVSACARDVELLAGQLLNREGPPELQGLDPDELHKRLAESVATLERSVRRSAQDAGIGADGA